MKTSTYVMLVAMGVLIGMAACGAKNDMGLQPSQTIEPPAQQAVQPPAAAQPDRPTEITPPPPVVQPPEKTEARPITTPPPVPPPVVQQQDPPVKTDPPVKQVQPPEEPKTVRLLTEKDKVSYILGTSVASSILAQRFEINLEPFMQGLSDVLNKKPLAMDPDEMDKFMLDYQQKRYEQVQSEGKENLIKGQAFLKENQTKPGVVALPSGLQYIVLREGDGPIPTLTDRVRVHYRGTFIDGQEFDSSYKRDAPIEFDLQGVIPGWIEAMQLMKVGSKWQLFVPPDLAYGPTGRGTIPPNSVLIFEVELLDIVKMQF